MALHSLLSEYGDVHAEFELENKYPGILRFIRVHPLANPCMLSDFFVFSSKDMKDEGSYIVDTQSIS